MVTSNDVPFYLEHLSSAFAAEFDKQYEGNIAKDYILLDLFCEQIANQLQDNLIKDEISRLYIDKKSAAYAVSYVGYIKGMKLLVLKTIMHLIQVCLIYLQKQ